MRTALVLIADSTQFIDLPLQSSYTVNGAHRSALGRETMITTAPSSKAKYGFALILAAIASLLTAAALVIPAGSLDPTFGNNGVAVTDLGSDSDSGGLIVLQSEGKILVEGSAKPGRIRSLPLDAVPFALQQQRRTGYLFRHERTCCCRRQSIFGYGGCDPARWEIGYGGLTEWEPGGGALQHQRLTGYLIWHEWSSQRSFLRG